MYIKSYLNKSFTHKGTFTNVRKLPSTNSEVMQRLDNENIVIATGNVMNMKDGKWIQVNLVDKSKGYVREDVVKEVNVSGANIAKMLVANDRLIFESLVRSAVLIAEKAKKGQDVSKLRKQFRDIFNRLTNRQNALKTSSLIKTQSGISEAYKKMSNAIKSLFGINGIGEPVSLTVIISVSLVAGALVSVLVYQWLKPKYDASKTDLKVSTDLETLLKKTDPDTAKKIKDNLEQQIDDAYDQGNKDGSFSGYGNVLKYGAFAVLGFIGIRALQGMNNGKKE